MKWFAAVVCFTAAASFGAELSAQYKDWPSTPQGYFLTRAERAAWQASVKTDADAGAFIAKFIASRGPGFAEEVANRAALADEHLSVAGRQGSRTLRGKIAILLGPPSEFGISEREVKGEGTTYRGLYGSVHDYVFTYSPERLPGPRQSKDVVIVVEVRPEDGSDRLADRKMSRQVDDLLEAAAQARLASAAPKP